MLSLYNTVMLNTLFTKPTMDPVLNQLNPVSPRQISVLSFSAVYMLLQPYSAFK